MRGWVMMTVLLIRVTMGEGAPAAISGIAVRWPQMVKLLRTVDTLGDVTTYLVGPRRPSSFPARPLRLSPVRWARRDVLSGVKSTISETEPVALAGRPRASWSTSRERPARAWASHDREGRMLRRRHLDLDARALARSNGSRWGCG